MRSIFILFLFLSHHKANAAAIPFLIKGTTSPESFSLYLYVPPANGLNAIFKSNHVQAGQFNFAGEFNPGKPVIARIYIDSTPDLSLNAILKKSFFYEFILDGSVNLQIDPKRKLLTVTGSLINEEFRRFKQIEVNFNNRTEKAKNNQLAYYSQLATFAKIYPASSFSQIAIERIMKMPQIYRYRLGAELSAMLAASDSSIRQSPAARNLKADILRNNSSSKYSIGTKLPDYVFNDGRDTVSISQFRGKYALIFFWASWSDESIRFYESLQETFLQYPTKRFTILQVSMDANLESWKSFFSGRKILWKQARLVRGWDEKVQSAFDIRGLPCTYLIDPEGKIIGKDLSIPALVEILRKLPA